MAKPWLKVWSNILDKEKIFTLSGDQTKTWVHLMAVALKHDRGGILPPIETVAFQLRTDVVSAQKLIDEMVSLKLIDSRRNHYVVHDWKHWQGDGMSDAERKRRQRERDRDMSRDMSQGKRRDNHVTSHSDVTNVSRVRAPEDKDSDSDKEKEPPTPSPRGVACVSDFRPQEPGPEFTELGHLAIQLSGDLSLGRWVSNMARLEHSAPAIRYALTQGAASNKWDQRWLQGILKRVATEGVPADAIRASPESNGASWEDQLTPAVRQRLAEWEEEQRARQTSDKRSPQQSRKTVP